jgi:hypothetical protein
MELSRKRDASEITHGTMDLSDFCEEIPIQDSIQSHSMRVVNRTQEEMREIAEKSEVSFKIPLREFSKVGKKIRTPDNTRVRWDRYVETTIGPFPEDIAVTMVFETPLTAAKFAPHSNLSAQMLVYLPKEQWKGERIYISVNCNAKLRAKTLRCRCSGVVVQACVRPQYGYPNVHPTQVVNFAPARHLSLSFLFCTPSYHSYHQQYDVNFTYYRVSPTIESSTELLAIKTFTTPPVKLISVKNWVLDTHARKLCIKAAHTTEVPMDPMKETDEITHAAQILQQHRQRSRARKQASSVIAKLHSKELIASGWLVGRCYGHSITIRWQYPIRVYVVIKEGEVEFQGVTYPQSSPTGMYVVTLDRRVKHRPNSDVLGVDSLVQGSDFAMILNDIYHPILLSDVSISTFELSALSSFFQIECEAMNNYRVLQGTLHGLMSTVNRMETETEFNLVLTICRKTPTGQEILVQEELDLYSKAPNWTRFEGTANAALANLHKTPWNAH